MNKVRRNSIDWSATILACQRRASGVKIFTRQPFRAIALMASKDGCAPIRSAFLLIGPGFIFALCLLLFAFPTQAISHRYHTSLTRMDYKAEDKNIEITIRLFIHDLENVLEGFAEKRIDVGKTPEIDKIIVKYLEENFVLKNKKDEKLNLKWVGKELNVDTAFVYLEASSDESIEGFKLQNTIFFESFAEQTNLLTARFENKKVDLLYKVGDKFKIISENKNQKKQEVR